MRGKYRTHHILEVVLLVIALAGFSASNSKANENSKYLDAVREFADNVLKYGRDTYGPKHTPLFVDGLNIHTHEPVKWIAPNGDRWILSNLASQQNLFRTLDGLTKITGDPKYRQAAMEAIEYAFANLQAPNGLFYWGGGISYDAQADKQCGVGIHSLKSNYPYYKLMWEVDPRLTRKFIEAYWSTHILDWSNLAMNRGVPVDKLAGEAWNHEYKGGPVFFQSWGLSFLVAGGDLFCAAGFLGEASGDDKPLVWAKRLMHRYVETRNPGVGLSGSHFTRYTTDRAQVQLGDDFKGHLVLTGTLFPSHPEIGDSAQWERYPAFIFVTPGIRHSPAIAPWASAMMLGDMLDADGKEFTQWALEELTAWGKAAYRKKDNSFIPMLTDGTSLEGYVCKKSGDYGRKGTVFLTIPAVPMHFWTYALAYRLTGDQFMWDMARNIAHGHGLGDIGFTTESSSQLKTATDCWSPYTLLGFIELYKRTENQEFLQIARRIGDNMLDHRLHEGFFVPSDKHIYAKFDTIEHLALLHLHVALRRTFSSVPEFWPSNSLFNGPYRDRAYASDYSAIYTLTESPYPAKSAEELMASGDVEGVRLFIAQGKDINALTEGSAKTLLHWAVIKGHKDAVELLLAVKDVQIDAEDEFSSTPLYYAVEGGYKEIVELLINGGADINVKGKQGKTALFYAVENNHKDIVELLIAKGADINVKGKQGKTALFYAVENNHKDIVELLIAKGADINAKDKWGYTPLYYAIRNEDVNMVKAIVTKGADVNLTREKGYPPLYHAVWNEDIDIVKLLVAKGAKFDVKVLDDRTAFHYAVSQGSKDIVEFLVSEGIDIPRLYLSACMGDLAGIKDLVEQGADINTKDELGWTPLYWAASMGQEEVTEFLLANGADVSIETNDGSTPLHQAAQNGSVRLVELFVSKDADVNAKDEDGNTPLHSAASAGNRAVVELLIARGASIDARGSNNWTPLHSAARSGHRDVVEILLCKGADVNAKDKQGRTALWWANRRGHAEIVLLLRKHGANE